MQTILEVYKGATMIIEQIKKLCLQHGMTMKDLSDKIGVDKSTISRWNNTNIPSTTALLKIADYFNVPMDFLLERSVYDANIISIQRAYDKMNNSTREKMMTILKTAFDEDFKEEN